MPGRLFVYGAGQLWTRSSFSPQLEASSPELSRYGISSDSVERFYDIIRRLGYPTSPDNGEGQRRADTGAGIVRFDYLASARQSIVLRIDGRGRRTTGLFSSPFAVSNGASEVSFDSGGLLQLTSRIGGARNEFNAYRSIGAQHTNLVQEGPSGAVRVGDSSLSFGSPFSPAEEERTTLEVSDRLVIPLRGPFHELQVGGTYAVQRIVRRGISEPNGSFLFASLADLEAGQALRFTRSLGDPNGEIRTGYAAGYLGDLWRVGDGLRIAVGIRGERRWYTSPLQSDSPVASDFGLTGIPKSSGWSVSPRLGFTWVRQTPESEVIVRGGTGEFRGAPPIRSLAAILAGAGNEEADVRLVCIGPAVPLVDWREYIRDPSTIPTSCAAGFPGSGSSSHGMVGFAPDYAPPKVWHSSLGARWRHKPTDTALEANVTLSRGHGLPLAADLNLLGTPYFGLTSEDGRPVYVLPGAIEASSGQLTFQSSRRSTDLGIVQEVNGRGRSAAEQLSLGIARLTSLGWIQAYYTFSRSIDQTTGLAGPGAGWATTAGDPRLAEWAGTDFAQRHALQLSSSHYIGTRATVTLIGRALSGTPFTPMVDSDINGDGVQNDRAFIFDPGSATDQEIRRGMATLLKETPASARSCLLEQIGRIAARNSCRTAWDPFLDIQLNLYPGGIRNPRLVFAIVAQNVTAGLDYLIHRPNELRGWGQYSQADPILLRTRGFDASRKEFRYQVNPNFGDDGARSSRIPFTLRIQGRLTIGADPATQELVASVADMRANLQPSEVHAELLRGWRNLPAIVSEPSESLRLELTTEQSAALRASADSIARRIDAIAETLAEGVSAPRLDNQSNSPAQPGGQRELLREAQALLDSGFATVRSVLTSAQWAKLPRPLREPPRVTFSVKPPGGILILPDL
ncbi:MAG: TonB-dependent receptor [Gemmatimonadota bacterium]|nr:TonB-dependent receptor [Gemmatimonadota bacterium]